MLGEWAGTHGKDGVICNYGITIPIWPQKEGGKMADKNNKSEHFSAYITIPAPVFFDKNLSNRAVLLYGLLSCMDNFRGYCWAKNETLAQYLGVDSDRTVRRLLGELEARGHIRIEQKNDGGTTIRKIFVTAIADLYNRPDKNVRSPGQKCPDRPDKNVRQNNINNNNIPPIAPQGAGDCKTTATDDAPKPKSRAKRRPTGGVALPEELEESFETFWDAYPDHRDKQKARQRWGQLKPDGDLLETILRAIATLKTTDQWQRGIFPLPSTFLNNRRWEDAEGITQAVPQTAPQQELPGGEWLE